jgi:hypothetical protein
MPEHKSNTTSYQLYSPDLVLSDFFLLGFLKQALQGSVSEGLEWLLDTVMTILYYISRKTLLVAFYEWL